MNKTTYQFDAYKPMTEVWCIHNNKAKKAIIKSLHFEVEKDKAFLKYWVQIPNNTDNDYKFCTDDLVFSTREDLIASL